MDNLLRKHLTRAGWRATASKSPVWVGPGGRRYVVFGEERPQPADRYVQALLSEAILRARAVASAYPDAFPVAYLALDRVTPLIEQRLEAFVREVAPNAAWLLVDSHGNFRPHIASAPELGARHAAIPAPGPRKTNLFSDFNQWLLKVLLGQVLPEKWLAVPRGRAIRNATVLAELADVSVAVASRFVAALDEEGHLDTRHGDLRLRHPLEFLEVWNARVANMVTQETVARFARGPLDDRHFRTLMLVAANNSDVALGLFGAAEALGIGRVAGAPRYIYLRSFAPHLLDVLGIVVGGAEGPPHNLIVAVPYFPKSTLGGPVLADGQRVTDVIQTWLDARHHHLRGDELAELIWRKALKPSLGDG